MKTINVSAAIIIHEGKILCVQRGKSKHEYISEKFEFPGGKIEPGEKPIETVVREISEELHMEIQPVREFITVTHNYPDFQLVMHSFICTAKRLDFVLTEHLSSAWLITEKLFTLDWAAADLPIVEKLIQENTATTM